MMGFENRYREKVQIRKGEFLKNLSEGGEGSHWFECSRSLPYLIFAFCFSLRDPSHLCGGWVVGAAYFSIQIGFSFRMIFLVIFHFYS